MALYKNRYRIESVRLQNWDYSNPGLYYITVCVKERLEILGQIINSKMVLNENGEILKTWLLKIDKRYENVKLDTWVIMPNHWHCVIDITGNDDKHDGGTMPVDTMPVDTMPPQNVVVKNNRVYKNEFIKIYKFKFKPIGNGFMAKRVL